VTVDGFTHVVVVVVPGPRGAPEAGVRPHGGLVVSGLGALRDALWPGETHDLFVFIFLHLFICK